MLGKNMGLRRNLLQEKVVRWNCETRWVSDNQDSYIPDKQALAKKKQFNFGKKRHIPVITKILVTLPQ